METPNGPFPFLLGERLFLAPLRKEDAPHYERWLNAPAMREFLYPVVPQTREAQLRALEPRLVAGPNTAVSFGIWLKEAEPRLIGDLSLFDINHRNQVATLAILIGEPGEWSRGYGREAMRLLLDYGFKNLNLRKVILTVSGHNTRAQKAYLALGFREVGRHHAHRFIAGVWQDKVLMEVWREGDEPT